MGKYSDQLKQRRKREQRRQLQRELPELLAGVLGICLLAVTCLLQYI